MKIVVLDGHTLNPGDLDWAPLKMLGQCAIYPRTPAAQVVERCHDADIVLTKKTVISAEAIEQLPQLKYIGVLASGYNVVAIEAARKANIVVTNAPSYGTASVSQMVFALLLEITQQVGHHAELVRQGAWNACPDFSFHDRPLYELAGKTMGIVGFGLIGRQVKNIANAFGLKVLASTAHPEKYNTEEGVEFIDIDELFSRCHVISLHCPLTEQTKHLVNTARLARIKHGAVLINTGRGQLIDEEAVIEALEEGYLGGYAADVLELEPPEPDHPLLAAPNTFITPHIAWATLEARKRLLDIVVENVAAFKNGQSVNQVG